MKLTVRNVDKKVLDDGRLLWRVRYDAEDLQEGEMPTFYHHFLEDQISYYMAAYDLDSVEETLDFILADPFHDEDIGIALLNSSDQKEEGVAHRARCARAKLRVRLSSRGITNPLEMIRSSYVQSPEKIAKGTTALHQARKEFRRLNNG